MSCIQADVKIPPHLHKKLAVHATQAEASKSKVIINTVAHYPEFTEDKSHPDWNLPIAVIHRQNQPLYHVLLKTYHLERRGAGGKRLF